MGRTHNKHIRVYCNGVDLSGYSRSVGALAWMFGTQPDAAVTDECKNILIGQGDIQAGSVNAFLDNDTAGLFANQAQGTKNLMVAIGAGAAPAAGNPVFAWKFEDTGYNAQQGDGFVVATLPLSEASYASTLTYKKPWGVLLHAKGAETEVNSTSYVDDYGASPPELGGIFVYHIFTSAGGNVTVKAQHSDTTTDGDFADITGATSGAVDASSTPVHGMIALGTTLAIKRYLRWQVVFNAGNSVTFAAAFIRNTL